MIVVSYIASNSSFISDGSGYTANVGHAQQDTIKMYRFKAKLIDTVQEDKINELCDHCAMAIRFHIDTSFQGAQFVDVVIFNSDLKKMTQKKPGQTFLIKAFFKYNAPAILIVPAVIHKNEFPILWCDSIVPNF